MTERERWIVYPLLFLALGAALRDKLSEHTKTKRIECQELVVNGESRVGQPPVTLVHIGAIERKSPDAPHVGQILVNGQIAAQAIQAEVLRAENIEAANINSDNFYFRRIPFAPSLLRAMPGISPADWLKVLQHQAAEAAKANAQGSGTPPVAEPPAELRTDRPAEQPATTTEGPAETSVAPPAE